VLLTNLADVIREHTSLEVIEEPGWKTRGHGQFTGPLQAIIGHHTAAPASSYKTNPYPSLKTVRDGRNLGRPDQLLGPLSQLGLQRDCKVRVIAAGVAWHAGATFWPWQNNWNALGIEAEHDGVSAWPADLYKAYVELCAGLQKGYQTPHGIWGHKEIAKPAGRKSDPNFSMSAFRLAVTRWTGNQEDDMGAVEQAALTRIETTLAAFIKSSGERWAQGIEQGKTFEGRDLERDASQDKAIAAVEALVQRLVDDPQSPVTG
jgi:hypothetical protein